MREFAETEPDLTTRIFGPDTYEDVDAQSSARLNIRELVQDYDTAQRCLAYNLEHPSEPPIDPLSGLPARIEIWHGVRICVINNQPFQAAPTNPNPTLEALQ